MRKKSKSIKKFNGKNYYRIYVYFKTKSKANQDANRRRKQGNNVRVVKHSSGKGYTLYQIKK